MGDQNSCASNTYSTNITEMEIEKCDYSEKFQPFQLLYKQNNKELSWDLIKSQDRVDVCIFNTSTKRLLFRKQFRPGGFLVNAFGRNLQFGKVDLNKYPPELGLTYELCSGSIENKLQPAEIAKNVVEKFTGCRISPNNLEKIMSFCFDTSPAGNRSTYFYCEIDEKTPKTPSKINPEELVEMSIQELKDLINKKPSINTTDYFLFGIYWFLLNKADKNSSK